VGGAVHGILLAGALETLYNGAADKAIQLMMALGMREAVSYLQMQGTRMPTEMAVGAVFHGRDCGMTKRVNLQTRMNT
jgi:hypothetical protein